MPEIPDLIKRKYIGDFFPEETVTFLGKQGIMGDSVKVKFKLAICEISATVFQNHSIML